MSSGQIVGFASGKRPTLPLDRDRPSAAMTVVEIVAEKTVNFLSRDRCDNSDEDRR